MGVYAIIVGEGLVITAERALYKSVYLFDSCLLKTKP